MLNHFLREQNIFPGGFRGNRFLSLVPVDKQRPQGRKGVLEPNPSS